MDRRESIRLQIKEVQDQIKKWQHGGVCTSASSFVLFLIFGVDTPAAFVFTLVPYVCATVASIPLMMELNRLCKELTGQHHNE